MLWKSCENIFIGLMPDLTIEYVEKVYNERL